MGGDNDKNILTVAVLSEKKGNVWLMSKKSAIDLLQHGGMDEQK